LPPGDGAVIGAVVGNKFRLPIDLGYQAANYLPRSQPHAKPI